MKKEWETSKNHSKNHGFMLFIDWIAIKIDSQQGNCINTCIKKYYTANKICINNAFVNEK